MTDRRIINKSLDINEKEEALILDVLSNYNFQIETFSKVRSVYKVKTKEGYICLKKMRHGKHKARNGSILVNELRENGFHHTAEYYNTKRGYSYVKTKKFIFYATEWIDGEECNLDNLEEACSCVKLLAEFHRAASKINTKKLQIKNNLKNWPKIFKNNIYDMEKFTKIIQRKKLKNEFDNLYLEYTESYYHRAMVALNFLNSSEYYKLSKAANDKKTICHDSFYYQNIIKKDIDYYIIDLDSIIIDLHINDLGKLIRRLMYKKEYQWDFLKVKSIIEAYSTVNPLSHKEIEAMLALIIFPHKFWKLGKKRYIKHKEWNEGKYLRKIRKLLSYNDMQQKFLEDYLAYLKEIESV